MDIEPSWPAVTDRTSDHLSDLLGYGVFSLGLPTSATVLGLYSRSGSRSSRRPSASQDIHRAKAHHGLFWQPSQELDHPVMWFIPVQTCACGCRSSAHQTRVISGPRLNTLQLQLHNYTIKHFITSLKQLLLHCCSLRQLLRLHFVLIATLILTIYYWPTCKRLQLCVSEKTRIFHESDENVHWAGWKPEKQLNQRRGSSSVFLTALQPLGCVWQPSELLLEKETGSWPPHTHTRAHTPCHLGCSEFSSTGSAGWGAPTSWRAKWVFQ